MFENEGKKREQKEGRETFWNQNPKPAKHLSACQVLKKEKNNSWVTKAAQAQKIRYTGKERWDTSRSCLTPSKECPKKRSGWCEAYG